MVNPLVEMACNSGLCAVNRIAQEWREKITLDVAMRNYELRNREQGKLDAENEGC